MSVKTVELGTLENLDSLIVALDDAKGEAYDARFMDIMVRFGWRGLRCWVNVLGRPVTGVTFTAGYYGNRDFDETATPQLSPFGVLAFFMDVGEKIVQKMDFGKLLGEIQSVSVLARMAAISLSRGAFKEKIIEFDQGVTITVGVSEDRQVEYWLRDEEKPGLNGWVRDPLLLAKIVWERYYKEVTE